MLSTVKGLDYFPKWTIAQTPLLYFHTGNDAQETQKKELYRNRSATIIASLGSNFHTEVRRAVNLILEVTLRNEIWTDEKRNGWITFPPWREYFTGSFGTETICMG